MDASTRSFHVYGKTPSGTAALKASREAISTVARRLLILVDGRRTLDELYGMLGRETVDQALGELETLGHVEMLRRFPPSREELPEFDVALLDAATPANVEPPRFETLADLPEALMPVGAALPSVQASTAAATLDATPVELESPAIAKGPAPAPPAAAAPEPVRIERRKTPRPPADAGAAPAGAAPSPTSAAPPAVDGGAIAPARPRTKAVDWQPRRAAAPWLLALIVVAGLVAGGVWMSAREFAGPPIPPPGSEVAAVGSPGSPSGGLPSAASPPVTPLPVAAAAPMPDGTSPAAPGVTADAPAPAGVVPGEPALPATAPMPATAPVTAAAQAEGAAPRRGILALPASPNAPGAGRPAAAALPAHRSLHVRSQYTPEIPKAVRDRGITTGHVAVVLHVNPEGAVERVELLGATPPDVYDKDMERSFGRWTFDPLGIPGRMTVDVDIRPPH